MLVLASSSAANSAAATIAIVLFAIIGIGYLALFIAALVSIISSTSYTSGMKALWILGCFAFPFVGSLFWFIWGRTGNG